MSAETEQDLAKNLRQSAASSERLLKENGELRARLERAEAAAGKAPHDDLELEARFRALESESREFANRYIEIEEENNNLANLAATALFASKLYAESERKLSKIQGFLELMAS